MTFFAWVVAIGLVAAALVVAFFVVIIVVLTRRSSLALESLEELRDAVRWQGERLVEVADAVERFPSTFVAAYERSKRWERFQLDQEVR